MKKLLFFVIIFLSLINSASAVEDNFNDCDITDWTLSGTGYSASSSGGIDGCYLLKGIGAGDAAATNRANKSFINGVYYEFDTIFKTSTNNVNTQSDSIYFKATAEGTLRGIQFTNDANFLTYTVSSQGFAIAPFTANRNEWHHYTFSIGGGNVVMNVTNSSTGEQVTPDQTVSFTDITSTRFMFYVNTDSNAAITFVGLDNIIISNNLPSTITDISFDADDYGLGSRASISYSIASSTFSSLFSYSVGIYRAGQEVKRFNGIPQTATLYYTFPETGNYQARLQSCLLCIFGFDTIASDSASVAQFQAYLFINETIPANRPFTVEYNAGYTVQDGAITAKLLNPDGTYTTDTIYYFSNSQSGSFSQTVHNIGQYLFELTDLSQGKVLVSVLSRSYYVPNIPTTNVSASYVNVTKDSFYKGEVVTGSYAIDNTNFSSYDTFTLDFYSVLRGISYSSQQVTEQVGDFNLYVPLAIEGQNKINLTGRNSTTNASLAEVSLNFSTINPFGYGISVTPTRVTPGQAFIVRAICPSPCRIEIVNQETDKTLLNKTYNSTTSFSYKINTIGFYAVILSDSSGNVQGMANIDVVTAANVSLTPSVGAPPGTIDVNTVNSMFSIFGIVAFWGFIIWIGVIFTSMGIMSRSAGGVNGTAMIAVAWISAVIIALIGLFAPYTIYVIVVSTIICAILFRVGRSSTVED